MLNPNPRTVIRPTRPCHPLPTTVLPDGQLALQLAHHQSLQLIPLLHNEGGSHVVALSDHPPAAAAAAEGPQLQPQRGRQRAQHELDAAQQEAVGGGGRAFERHCVRAGDERRLAAVGAPAPARRDGAYGCC